MPSAPNCRLSVGRWEEAGRWFKIQGRQCYLINKNDKVSTTGTNRNRMYLLDAENTYLAETMHRVHVSCLPSWGECNAGTLEGVTTESGDTSERTPVET